MFLGVAARVAADALRLTAHGSLGVILRALRRGLRSRNQVLAILRSLPASCTLHIKRELLDEVIRQVEADSTGT